MKLRRLNQEGIRRMEEFLDSLTSDNPQEWPEYILTDRMYSESIIDSVEVEKIKFDNRLEAGEYFCDLFDNTNIPNLLQDKGIWSWLSLLYFDQLCPERKEPGQRARWIPDEGWTSYYRHLLRGPFQIYRAHRDNPECAFVVLCNPIHSPGDLVEQIASRQELVTNKAFMTIATEIYIDKKTNKPKWGASGKSGGSPRRLADIFNQFDLTWDLYYMNKDEIFAMLPAEFDKFRF